MTTQLDRGLGLPGALVLIVGYIVGGSIFVLPGQLGASAGPAVSLSYVVAGVVALFAAGVTAQVARAHPVSGGNYVAVSRRLSPFWGFSIIWAAILANAMGNPLIAYAFAQYLKVFIPALPLMATAFAVFALFTVLNLVGVVFANRIQAALVVLMMIVLLIFGAAGVFTADTTLWTPFAPNGAEAVLIAALPAYFSYAGFLVLAEMGDEIREPRRTIPLAIGIAFVLLVLTYTLVPLALTGHVPWVELENQEASISAAAARFLPSWTIPVVTLAALAAAATSINGSIMSQARAFLAAGRDGVLPSFLAKVGERSRVPVWGVLVTSLLSMIGIFVGAELERYAIVTVVCFMGFQVLVGLAVLSLPRATSGSVLDGRFMRWFLGGGVILTSGLLLLGGLSEDPMAIAIFGGWMLLGVGYYLWRRSVLRGQGRDLSAIMREEPAYA